MGVSESDSLLEEDDDVVVVVFVFVVAALFARLALMVEVALPVEELLLFVVDEAVRGAGLRCRVEDMSGLMRSTTVVGRGRPLLRCESACVLLVAWALDRARVRCGIGSSSVSSGESVPLSPSPPSAFEPLSLFESSLLLDPIPGLVPRLTSLAVAGLWPVGDAYPASPSESLSRSYGLWYVPSASYKSTEPSSSRGFMSVFLSSFHG